MLWWSAGRVTVRSSRVFVGAVLALVAACGGTSRSDLNDAPGGHAGKATSSGGHGGSGAADGAVGGVGGVGGSVSAGRGGTGTAGLGHGGDAGGGGDGASGGGGGHAGHAESGAGQGGSAGEGTAGRSAGGRAAGGKAGGATGGKAGSASGGAGMNAGTGGGQSGAGQGGTAALAAIKPALDAYCGAIRNCCEADDAPAQGACESDYTAQSENFASLTAGYVTLDPAVLAKCEAAYAGADQCDLNAVVAACQGLFLGTSAVNGPCTQGYDCDRSQGEMTCLIAGDCNNDPMGVCTPVPHAQAGETCLTTCESGEDCSSTTCGVGDTNALCFEDDGLYCEYFDSGSICKPIVPVGTTCSSAGSPECGSEAYCDVTCKALSKLGDPCGYGCRHELECGPDQTCIDPVWNDQYSCMGYPPGL
jgi:hypothetical protein